MIFSRNVVWDNYKIKSNWEDLEEGKYFFLYQLYFIKHYNWILQFSQMKNEFLKQLKQSWNVWKFEYSLTKDLMENLFFPKPHLSNLAKKWPKWQIIRKFFISYVHICWAAHLASVLDGKNPYYPTVLKLLHSNCLFNKFYKKSPSNCSGHWAHKSLAMTLVIKHQKTIRDFFFIPATYSCIQAALFYLH